jgi:uncharacterized protein YkwD
VSTLLAGDADTLRREAATLTTARRFADAAERLDRARTAGVSARLGEELAGRAEDLRLAAGAMDALVTTAKEHPGRFAAVMWEGTAAPLTITSADAEGFAATLPGGNTRLRWASLEPVALKAFIERAKFAGEDLLRAAAMMQCLEQTNDAELLLVRYAEGGGDGARLASHFARWCGERRVPEGGYVVHEGRLLTVADRDRLLLEVRMASAKYRVADGDAATRRAAVDELLSLGESARWTLLKSLYAARDRLARDLSNAGVVRDPRTRAFLQEELKKARAAALEFINDAKAYPYPSPDHRGQDEVNRRVEVVRRLWLDPVQIVRAQSPEVDGLLKEGEEVEALLAKHEEGYVADPVALRGPANAALDLRAAMADPYDAKVLAFNEKVKTTADPEERENVLAVNEYRMMMGRTAVKIEERLLRAARGHSRHMRENNYFSHDTTTPGLETPGKRAARQGYGGGVGENIYVGSASGRDAFHAWFHSSGHHRNMVGGRWTDLGCGRSGSHFTQLFGALTGKSLADPDPLPPPAADCAPEPLPEK